MRQRTRGQRARGFTLVELMTAVAIIGVMVSLAIFSVSGLSDRARATTFLGELALDISAAKLLAARHGQATVVVFSCDTDPAKVTENGYMVFREVVANQVDLDNLATLPAPAANLLLREKAMKMGLCVLASSKPASSKFNAGAFPWKSIFTMADGQSQTCTFCKQYSTAWRGAIRVLPDGRMFMSGNGNTKGGGVLFTRSDYDGQPVNQALAILVPSGMTRVF